MFKKLIAKSLHKEEPPAPATLEQVVDSITKDMDEPSRVAISQLQDPRDMAMFHHTTGRAQRNTYNLWDQSSPLHLWFFRTWGIRHADDMSAVIMSAIWHRVREVPYDLAPDIERFRQHWARAGLGLDMKPLR